MNIDILKYLFKFCINVKVFVLFLFLVLVIESFGGGFDMSSGLMLVVLIIFFLLILFLIFIVSFILMDGEFFGFGFGRNFMRNRNFMMN